ncbi:MAG: macro domain-containing protein [Candidatus Thorarchaeota archaeon]
MSPVFYAHASNQSKNDTVESVSLLKTRHGEIEFEVVTGDITEIDADAIVNAANSDLWMGSGVAGAIKSKGGIEIEKEAMSKGPIRPGEAVITTAGRLKARHVIHCAGMPPGGAATYDYVKSSVEHAMRLAAENNLKHIAFPAIGAGVGGLSMEESARAIVEGIAKYAEKPGSVRRVILVGYRQPATDAFADALRKIAGTG